VSLSSGDEVPHIFTRNSRLRSGEFLITSAKRLFQQHRPEAVLAVVVKLRCNKRLLLDHLVGAREHRRRHFEPERVRRTQIDHELELGRLQRSKSGASYTEFKKPLRSKPPVARVKTPVLLVKTPTCKNHLLKRVWESVRRAGVGKGRQATVYVQEIPALGRRALAIRELPMRCAARLPWCSHALP
jgi:hypothetical protein